MNGHEALEALERAVTERWDSDNPHARADLNGGMSIRLEDIRAALNEARAAQPGCAHPLTKSVTTNTGTVSVCEMCSEAMFAPYGKASEPAAVPEAIENAAPAAIRQQAAPSQEGAGMAVGAAEVWACVSKGVSPPYVRFFESNAEMSAYEWKDDSVSPNVYRPPVEYGRLRAAQRELAGERVPDSSSITLDQIRRLRAWEAWGREHAVPALEAYLLRANLWQEAKAALATYPGSKP